jgi:integrase
MKNDPILNEFIDNRNLVNSTKIRYMVILKNYCDYTKLKPEELIDEAEMEEESGIRLRKRKIKSYLIGFKKYLQDKDHSELTVKNSLSIIRSFYHEFEIELPYTRSKRRYSKQESKEDLPDKDDIIHALKFVSLKYSAIILLMMSSGMGKAEVLNLKFTDFLKSIETYINGSTNIEEITSILERKANNDELIISTWNISRVKTRMPYTTFSTYESIEAILLYLKSSPAFEGEYLFRSQRTNKELPAKTFGNQFNIINYRAGFGKVDRQIFFRSHNLRKYFTNVLHKNKVTKERIDWMLGHQIDNTSSSYFKSDISDLREEYVRCIPDLSIKDTEIHTMKSPEFIKVETELNETQKRLKRLERFMEEKERTDNLKKPE